MEEKREYGEKQVDDNTTSSEGSIWDVEANSGLKREGLMGSEKERQDGLNEKEIGGLKRKQEKGIRKRGTERGVQSWVRKQRGVYREWNRIGERIRITTQVLTRIRKNRGREG